MSSGDTEGFGGLSRRQMLKGGAMASALSAVPLLAGCTTDSEAEQKETKKSSTAQGPNNGATVTFVVHDNNPFFVPVRRGFERFGELAGWETRWVGPPRQDTAETVNLQSSALQAKPDGVIFTRIDSRSFDANIRQAQESNVAVLLSNVASEGYEDLDVGFVGQDFVPAGQECGRQAARFAQERTKRRDGLIVITNGAPGNSALEQRARGTEQGVEDYNRENDTRFEAQVQATSFEEAEAVGRVDAIYRRNRDDVVGWAAMGIDHQFIATWAQSNQLGDRFAIGGFDLIAPILRAIQRGQIQFTVGQNPWAQGWVAAALLFQQLDPGYPSFTYDTGAEVIDASNIEQVLKREQPFLS